jgi:hypothetical protein
MTTSETVTNDSISSAATSSLLSQIYHKFELFTGYQLNGKTKKNQECIYNFVQET